MEKKKREKMRTTLTSSQEVNYQREFRMADRAGGFTSKRPRS
ncbi:YfhE family protein [Bacillus sp. T3]|nr:YfhE family protein [Bacillus sp. T3]